MAPRSWESKWEIKQELGRGGQGKTSLVVSKDGSGQQGVLKTLNRGRSVQARGRMYREVVSLDTLAKAQVKVPQVLDSNTGEYADENVELYFVMEYIPGKTLKDEIIARGRLPLEKAVAMAMDLCKIVAAAHRNDVLHRDLKPDNIVVRDFGAADLVIVDYGLSYLEEDSPQDLTHLDEQFRSRFLALPETNTPGGDRRDKRSDITAVCAVLYYCVTEVEPCHLQDSRGRPPHLRESYSVRQALQGEARCEQLELFFDRAFAVEVENRFQSCEEVMTRLETVLKPPSLDEDPAVVSAKLAKRLRQDRKTLLAEYSQLVQPLLPKMQQLFHRIAQGIAPPFQPTLAGILPMMLNSFPNGIDPLGMNGISVNLAVRSHNLSRSISLVVGSKGNQCILLRGTSLEARTGKRVNHPAQKMSVQWDELIWFDPSQLPRDEQLQAILNQSVIQMMRDLTDEILPN